MIEFQTVVRETRSLIHRRQQVLTFLGSVFAATGIVLQNVLHGGLPPGLKSLEGHVFAFYALIVMVPTLILALRMARLHGGMVLNGVLYNRLMQEQTFTRPGDPRRAARHNFFGVSFLQFLLTDLIAGFSAHVLAMALGLDLWRAAAVGGGVVVAWLAYYFYFHHKAAGFAFRKIAAEPCGPFTREDWHGHISSSLEDANHGLLADLGFVGLIVFSVFEKLSGLDDIKVSEGAGFALEDVKRYGPLLYAGLMLLTCVFGLLTYLRVRVAIGLFSLQLDPTDRPFRPLRLTDSLLGYLLLAFLFALSLHLFLTLLVPSLAQQPRTLLAVDAGAFAAAVVVEQVTLIVCGLRYHGK